MLMALLVLTVLVMMIMEDNIEMRLYKIMVIY